MKRTASELVAIVRRHVDETPLEVGDWPQEHRREGDDPRAPIQTTEGWPVALHYAVLETLVEIRDLLGGCPIPTCSSRERYPLPVDWQEAVHRGERIPIIGCGNPWHYTGVER